MPDLYIDNHRKGAKLSFCYAEGVIKIRHRQMSCFLLPVALRGEEFRAFAVILKFLNHPDPQLRNRPARPALIAQ